MWLITARQQRWGVGGWRGGGNQWGKLQKPHRSAAGFACEALVENFIALCWKVLFWVLWWASYTMSGRSVQLCQIHPPPLLGSSPLPWGNQSNMNIFASEYNPPLAIWVCVCGGGAHICFLLESHTVPPGPGVCIALAVETFDWKVDPFSLRMSTRPVSMG